MATQQCERSLARVRVEDDSSIGRSYARTGALVPGLGAARKAVRTTAWRDAYWPATKALESYTLAKTHLSRASRTDVLEYFLNTWNLYDTLFCSLRDDSIFYSIPDKLRRPLIFYSGHTACVYVNKMHLAGLLDRIDPYFEKLFETGVDEMSWDSMEALQHEDFAWPEVAEVVAYRAKVKEAVVALIKAMPDPREAPVTQESPYWALFMGFEHERIHLETSAVLIHQLPIDAVLSIPEWRTGPTFCAGPSDAPANSLVPVPAGRAVLGKPRDFPSFGWDNEYGQKTVEVPAFEAASLLVSNAEFLPFVEAGGYTEKRWWVGANGDDEGWRWRSYRNATHPSFWVATAHPDMRRYCGGTPAYAYQKDDGHPRAGAEPVFRYRSLFDIVEMPWDWPAEVNYHEATAFLRWKAACEGSGATYRVPTEAEYHLLRGDPVPFPEASTGEGVPAAGRSSAAGVSEAAHLSALIAAAKPRRLRSAVGTVTFPGVDAPSAAEDAPVDVHGRVLLPDGPADGAEAEAKAAPALAAGDAASRVDVMMQPYAAGNLNMRWHSSTPVHMYPPSSAGFHDPHGNVWQWVEDHFAPLPGFEIHYLYDDFSAPCFDGWHTGMTGGSWVSTGDEASSFARFHFRRHFFQHLGFRYVRVPAGVKEAYPGAATACNLWERGSMAAVSSGITDAYAAPAERVAFPRETLSADAGLAFGAALAAHAAKVFVAASAGAAATPASAKVLHVGCGVGGGSFDLVRAGFGSVVGVDASEPAVRHARIFQHHGQFEYERTDEGVLTTTVLARVAAGTDRSRVSFFVGDAAAGLGADIACQGPFDVLVLDDQLVAQTQPLDLLAKLAPLVRPGGVCVVASSNRWDPAVTPRNSWLGGFLMNGEPISTAHMLRYHMERAGFAFAGAADLPRMRRLSSRSFALDVMEVTAFTKAA